MLCDTFCINLSSQKLHNVLRKRISSSRILSMVRPSLEAGLMRWANLQKAGERPCSIVLRLRRPFVVFIAPGSASIGRS